MGALAREAAPNTARWRHVENDEKPGTRQSSEGFAPVFPGDPYVRQVGVGTPRASTMVQLQRTVGNAAVVQMLGRQRQGAARIATSPVATATLQRCGATPCNCSPDERARAESASAPATPGPQRLSVREDAPGSPHVHRFTGLVLQRHPGFRVKGELKTEVLATPELQTAASSADQALEVGKSSGDAVARLQRALTTAGHPVPVTSNYDAATQQAVASFQSEHGIPFPTGRQAGPKTLSTLDDHLLGNPGPKPQPDKKCDQYEPGERERSLRSAGLTQRTGGLGQELRLFNFGAGQGRMKPEHEAAVKQLIKDFDLFEPESTFEVDFIRGFTDSVDAEELNALLREQRALDVQFVMKANGVPDAPDGQAAAQGSFDPGCDPSGRGFARAVFIRLKRKPKKPKKPGPPIKPPPTPQEACGLTFAKWSLQGVAQGGPPLKPGATATEILFMLRAKDDTTGATMATRMISFTGIGGGASLAFPVTIPLPSQTDFETLPPRRTFDDFAGGGVIIDAGASAGIGFSLMKGVVHPRTNPAELDLGGFQLGLGIGAEAVGGEWKLVGGCF